MMAPQGQERWFHHLGVRVRDLDATIAWWRDMLGFTPARRDDIAAIARLCERGRDLAWIKHRPGGCTAAFVPDNEGRRIACAPFPKVATASADRP